MHNTTTTAVKHRQGVANTGRTHPTAQKIFAVIVVISLLLAVIVEVRGCNKKAEAKKAADQVAVQKVTNTTLPVRQVVQMPDCATPCTIDIAEIRDIYTDGEPIYALPPGWSESNKIYYSGKGHLVVQGGDIHSGQWKFWSADPSKVVLIRVFVVK